MSAYLLAADMLSNTPSVMTTGESKSGPHSSHPGTETPKDRDEVRDTSFEIVMGECAI